VRKCVRECGGGPNLGTAPDTNYVFSVLLGLADVHSVIAAAVATTVTAVVTAAAITVTAGTVTAVTVTAVTVTAVTATVVAAIVARTAITLVFTLVVAVGHAVVVTVVV
jgi:hypothetical protein